MNDLDTFMDKTFCPSSVDILPFDIIFENQEDDLTDPMLLKNFWFGENPNVKRGSSDKKLNSSGDKKLNSSCDKKLNSDHHENSKKRRKKVSNKSSTSHDEKLKQLEAQLLNLDPNSEEAKSQRRLIRNRMSAQLHRERKKAYVDQLENELYTRDAEILRLQRQVETLIHENGLLESQVLNAGKGGMVSVAELRNMVSLTDDGILLPASPGCNTDVDHDSNSHANSSDHEEEVCIPSKNIAMLLAVVFSVAFFGNCADIVNSIVLKIDGGHELNLMDIYQDSLLLSACPIETMKGTVWENIEEDEDKPMDQADVLCRPAKRLKKHELKEFTAKLCGSEKDVQENPSIASTECYQTKTIVDKLRMFQNMSGSYEKSSITKWTSELLPHLRYLLKTYRGKKKKALHFLFPIASPSTSDVKASYLEIKTQSIVL